MVISYKTFWGNCLQRWHCETGLFEMSSNCSVSSVMQSDLELQFQNQDELKMDCFNKGFIHWIANFSVASLFSFGPPSSNRTWLVKIDNFQSNKYLLFAAVLIITREIAIPSPWNQTFPLCMLGRLSLS